MLPSYFDYSFVNLRQKASLKCYVKCYVKSLLLISRCKIEHSFLVLYIQKNFSATFKTAYMYVFFSELTVVKIDHVYELGNYNRHSI